MNIELYQRFFESAPISFVCFKLLKDSSGQVENGIMISANKTFMQLWKRKPEEVIGKTVLDFFQKDNIQNQSWWNELTSSLTNRIPFDKIVHDFLPDRPLRIRTFPLSEEEAGCILRDVSNEVMMNEEIEGLLSVSLDMSCIANTDGAFLRVNSEFEKVLGYSVKDLRNQTLWGIIHPEDVDDAKKALDTLMQQAKIQNHTVRCRCKDGSYKTIEWHAIPNGELFFATARDVTEYIEKEEVLRIAAVTDPLTGLFNRQFLYERIHKEIEKAKTKSLPLSIISVDIDHFKYVNDLWGHPIGDEVLERTAQMLKQQLRQSDFLARVGGEEFLAVLPNTDINGASLVAERMRISLFDNSHPRVGRVTASFGVAQLEQTEDFNQWYKRADDAVYQAKEQGRNRVVTAGEPEIVSPSNTLYITWDESQASGNPVIDDQHQALLQEGNKLVFLSVSGAEPEKISHQIDNLLIHVSRHFATEETILRHHHYTGLEEHWKIHRELERKTTELAQDYIEKNTRSPIFLSFVINDLIVGHLLHEDIKFFSLFKK